MNSLNLTIFFSLLFIAFAASANTFYPVPFRIGLRQYVLFGERLLVFDLPQMTLVADKTYGTIISFAPIYTHSGNILYFSDGQGGHFEIDLTTSSYTLSQSSVALPDGGAPASGYLKSAASPLCYTDPANPTIQYCFNGGSPATVTKLTSGVVTATVSLGQSLQTSSFIKLDSSGVLYVTGQNSSGTRGTTNMEFFTLQTTPTLAVTNGSQTLIHTASSGCPVEPRSCEPDSLLYMDADMGVISYVFGNAIGGTQLTFRITLEAFTFTPCTFSNATLDDLHPSVAPVIKTGSCPIKLVPKTCNGTGICGANDLCCVDIRTGNRCYNPTLASCVLDNAGKTVLCGFFDGACAGFCYDKRHYICNNGTLQFIG